MTTSQRPTVHEAVAMLKGFTPSQLGMIMAEAANAYYPPPPPPKNLTVEEWAARLESIPPGDTKALAVAVAEMHEQHQREKAAPPQPPKLPDYAESLDAADSIALTVLGEMARWGYLTYGDIGDISGLIELISGEIRSGVTEGNLAEFARYANGQDADGQPLDQDEN